MGSSRRNRNIQPDRNNSGEPQGNLNGQPNINNLGQLLNNVDLNQLMGQFSQMFGAPSPGSSSAPRANTPRDPRLEVLQAMKPFLNARRSDMLDRIGQVYSIVRIIQKRR